MIGDPGIDRLADLVLPIGFRIDRVTDLYDQFSVARRQQFDEALLLAGVLAVKGALRGAGVPDDVGDGGLPVALLADGRRKAVE